MDETIKKICIELAAHDKKDPFLKTGITAEDGSGRFLAVWELYRHEVEKQLIIYQGFSGQS